MKYYDIDVIISVGYRVKSKRGTAFRIWARKIIKDYLVKGYAVNDRIRKRADWRGAPTSGNVGAHNTKSASAVE